LNGTLRQGGEAGITGEAAMCLIALLLPWIDKVLSSAVALKTGYL
jgi:hypothetical protein